MRDLSLTVRFLVLGVGGLGAGLLAGALLTANWSWTPVVMLPLAVAASFLRFDLRSYEKHKITVNIDIAITFFMLALVGPGWAMLALLVRTIVYGLVQRVAAYKTVFNCGVLLVSCWAAGVMIFRTPASWLITLPVATALYFLLNSGLVAIMIALLNHQRPFSLVREIYSWTAMQHITLAVAGFALGKIVEALGWWGLLAALPIPMLHFTFGLYARANDQRIKEQEALSSELIRTLAAVVDARDAYTFGHSTFVARYSEAIAEQMGYTKEQLARLYKSALLHDIGKVGIPESILFKPGRLTAEEYATMKRHAVIGYQIVRQIRSLNYAAQVALHHHERWDGSGYPDRLKGEQVDLDSRIVGVADSLETILSDRPYRKASTLDEALAEIDRCAGTLYDPAVVAALHRVVEAKGRSFFVNSARLVQPQDPSLFPWSPEELTRNVAPAIHEA